MLSIFGTLSISLSDFLFFKKSLAIFLIFRINSLRKITMLYMLPWKH